MRDIYFERNISARQNKNFGRHFVRLKYFTYHLQLLVPVLAPNYKQHILAKVRKVCYSLAELYVKSVYLNLLWCRGACRS
jgi:hypothetical protein